MSLYTIREAAAVYSIGRNRLYNAVRTGDLRSFRPDSRSYLLAEEDIEAWIRRYPYDPTPIDRRRKTS